MHKYMIIYFELKYFSSDEFNFILMKTQTARFKMFDYEFV